MTKSLTLSDAKITNIYPKIIDEQIIVQAVQLTLFIPENLDYFKGHFPDAAILPGVVQLHWVVEYAKNYFSLGNVVVKNVEVLKFQDVIVPGHTLVLSITKNKQEKVVFTYRSDKGQHASGRIVFEDVS